MIQIITGQKGEGKTKQLIALANDNVKQSKGHVIYIDSTTQHRLDLSHQIRLIEASSYPLQTHQDFFGFLCGILSSNHDIETVFIDELTRLTRMSIDQLSYFIEKLKQLSSTYNIHFVVGASCSHTELPSHLIPYLVA
ncbi:MAG: ATP-binding protein [Cellulosilyticaceae bacterium]